MWQMLGLHGHDARRWEPKRLRLRLFTIPATLARHGRQLLLHLAIRSPCSACEPCEKLKRATSMPESMRALSPSTESHAGPSVQMSFVRLIVMPRGASDNDAAKASVEGPRARLHHRLRFPGA